MSGFSLLANYSLLFFLIIWLCLAKKMRSISPDDLQNVFSKITIGLNLLRVDRQIKASM